MAVVAVIQELQPYGFYEVLYSMALGLMYFP
jgi:hypothetical protein